MTTRRTLLKFVFITLGLSLANPVVAQSAETIPVVATFSILGDMVKRVGGEHVVVTTLVGPDGDAHVYQPTPADARAVSKAKLLFVNGLEFEGWIDRLLEASEYGGIRIVATEGVDAIAFEEDEEHQKGEEHAANGDHKNEDGEEHVKEERDAPHHGTLDPHAWQSLENGVIYVRNLSKALSAADPDNAISYKANADVFVAELQALDKEILALTAAMPEGSRTVVTSHDAFGYFAKRYGLRFVAPQGLSTDSDPSAADVAKMITQIRREKIKAVFVESITDNRLLVQIANETGATIGGALYSDALSDGNGPAATYLDMMRHNAMTLTNALGS